MCWYLSIIELKNAQWNIEIYYMYLHCIHALQMNLKLLLLNDEFCSVDWFLKHYSV